jgi:hypothetical protein
MQQTTNINQEKALDLLKTNYQNLHFAYWECHKVFWTMTSIFLPITLTAFAWIVKDIPKTDVAILVISWFMVFSLLTYWFRTSRYLDSFNDKRRVRLKVLENHFNKLDCAVRLNGNEDFYKQYNLEYKEGIKNLTSVLYIVLLIATLGLIIAKLSG